MDDLIVSKVCKENKPLLLFVNERYRTVELALLIADTVKRNPVSNRKNGEKIDFGHKNVLDGVKIREYSLFSLINQGICVHHAGLGC